MIDILMFMLSLEIGVIPNGHIKMYESYRDVHTEVSYYGDFNFEARLAKTFFVGVKAKIFLWKVKDGITFNPDAINFTFYTGLKLKNIELGFRHFCDHPIKAWEKFHRSTIFERSYQKIYLKVKLKGGFK